MQKQKILTKFYEVLDFNITLYDVDMTVKKFKRRYNGDFVVILELRKDYGRNDNSKY